MALAVLILIPAYSCSDVALSLPCSSTLLRMALCGRPRLFTPSHFSLPLDARHVPALRQLHLIWIIAPCDTWVGHGVTRCDSEMQVTLPVRRAGS